MKIRRLLLFIVYIISLQIIGSDALAATKNVAVLHGKFNHFDPARDKMYLNYILTTLTLKKQDQVRISEKGEYEITVFVKSDIQEIILKYETWSYPFLLKRGDTVYFEVDNPTAKKDEVSNAGLKMKGTGYFTNFLIHKYANTIAAIEKLGSSAVYEKITTSLDEYKIKRLAELQNQERFLDSFLKENNIKDELYIDWVKAKIRYAAGYDLSLLPVYGNRNDKGLSHKDSYFTFLKNISPAYTTRGLYSSYVNYIKVFTSDIQILCNRGTFYASQRDADTSWLVQKNVLFALYLKTIDELAAGIKGNTGYLKVMIFNNSYLPMKIDSSFLIVFKKETTPELYAQLFDSSSKKTITMLQAIANYDAPADLKKKLSKYFSNQNGKVTVVDFWFTNCAPCMIELPKYNYYIDRYKDNVNFIFFGVYMDEKEWSNTIRKTDIKGEHHLISKNELAFFEKFFQVSGFPHHAIIDRNNILLPYNSYESSIFKPETEALISKL